MRVERQRFVVERVDGKVFAVPEVAPFVVILSWLASNTER